jgi:hypothetical protein
VTHCGECGEAFRSRDEARLAMFTTGFSSSLTAAHLCPACWSSFQQRGGPGPNVGSQARAAAAAARNRRNDAPLVPGVPGVRRY